MKRGRFGSPNWASYLSSGDWRRLHRRFCLAAELLTRYQSTCKMIDFNQFLFKDASSIQGPKIYTFGAEITILIRLCQPESVCRINRVY